MHAGQKRTFDGHSKFVPLFLLVLETGNFDRSEEHDMPIISPQNPEVTHWKGLHLFHYAISNCSQRVRIMLEEKNLNWTSHHLDLARDEHVTPWYQGVNPKGVVPTLIDDGVVVVESTDILTYLDERFGDHRLIAAAGTDIDQIKRCLGAADSVQGAIKLLSHEFLFKLKARKKRHVLARFQQTVHNRDLVAFHTRFSSAEGFNEAEIQHVVCEMHKAFQQLEQQLQHHAWLAGESFSIADIAWVVNIHRMELMRFPLVQYPRLHGWYRRMAARPSYRKALLAYEPLGIRSLLRCYSFLRTVVGKNPFDATPC